MRIFFVVILLVVLASCNPRKALQQDLTGSWQVYKYNLHGADATYLFDSLHPGYTITFTNNGQFVETDTSGAAVTLNAGTYTFKNDNQVLALMDSVAVVIDSVTVTTIGERDYILFDLNKQTVQLLTDTSDTYMSKK